MKVMTIVGTRPEIIKLSTVIKLLDVSFKQILVHTGQNFDYELNEVFFEDLGIRKPDHFLGVNGGSPAHSIGSIIISVDDLLEQVKPDAVLIYGDTNSCLSIIAAKRRKIPIFHLEAGNRSFDQNVPEELNRKIVDHLSDVNLTLTEHARRYLIAEGINPELIFKVGSLMPEVIANNKNRIERSDILIRLGLEKKKYFIASLHREENVDCQKSLASMISELKDVANHYDLPVFISTHPRTKARIEKYGISIDDNNLNFIKPLGFHDYNNLQINAYCVLSDSGTLTEESSILNFPSVMIRSTHERPEGIDVGISVIASPGSGRLIEAVKLAISCSGVLNHDHNPIIDFRDKNVSEKIIKIIFSYTDYVNRYIWRKN